MLVDRLTRYRGLLAIAGGVVCLGQLLPWMIAGGWPLHDSIAFWLAGRHLVEGGSVYGGDPVFLAFWYAPPWAVIMAPLSMLDPYAFTALLLALQVLALRYVAGSWTNAALCGWLPFVPRELATGNIDLIMAAAILAGMRALPGSGAANVFFALAKFSSVLAVRRWREAAVAAAVLVALTLPWLYLWPEWLDKLLHTSPLDIWVPLWLRLPVAGVLLALRRPWARAAAAGLATPAFYYQSPVLLLPAARLWLEARGYGWHALASAPGPRAWIRSRAPSPRR